MKAHIVNQSFNVLMCKGVSRQSSPSSRLWNLLRPLQVLEFNLGPRFFQEALLDTDIEAGSHHFAYAVKATQKMEKAQVKALGCSRASHNRRKMEAVADAEKDREQRVVSHNRRKKEAVADAEKDREQRGAAHAPGAF